MFQERGKLNLICQASGEVDHVADLEDLAVLGWHNKVMQKHHLGAASTGERGSCQRRLLEQFERNLQSENDVEQ